ncbi:MAG: hypothetical protein HY315_09350, partial [Acidobacteria bacterium]|nr:hypothetical protein [Acidobacteriota bacterium]
MSFRPYATQGLPANILAAIVLLISFHPLFVVVSGQSAASGGHIIGQVLDPSGAAVAGV